MKVAVIGANGQLGSDLLKIFNKNTIGLTHEMLDITDYNSLNLIKEIKPNVIVNTAAETNVDLCEENPTKSFATNSLGALNVAKISSETNSVDIYISTDFVFDGTKKEKYTEYDSPNPLNIYGATKYLGELFTRNYSKKYYIIRVASLFGVKGARGKGGNFINTIINKAKNGEKLRIVNDITMSPTYTMHVSKAIKKLVEINAPSGIYHAVNEGACTWYEFAKKVFKILKWDVEIEPISINELNLKAKRPTFSALENKKLHKLGINMPSCEDAIREYLIEMGYLK